MWKRTKSDVVLWTESEGASYFEHFEHNFESLALNNIEQNWSGEKISLFLGVALSCHKALGLFCQEMHEVVCCGLSSPLSQYAKAILSPWKGCDSEER